MSKLKLRKDNQFNGMEKEYFKQMLKNMGFKVEDTDEKGCIIFDDDKYETRQAINTLQRVRNENKVAKKIKCHIKKNSKEEALNKQIEIINAFEKFRKEFNKKHGYEEERMICPTCNGSGFDPYDWRDPRQSFCHQCNGKGYITK